MDYDTDNLIQEKSKLTNIIIDLQREIGRLRKRINIINNTLLEKCDHDWEIDNSYMDEHTVYRCTKCQCYPDYSVKMSKYPL